MLGGSYAAMTRFGSTERFEPDANPKAPFSAGQDDARHAGAIRQNRAAAGQGEGGGGPRREGARARTRGSAFTRGEGEEWHSGGGERGGLDEGCAREGR